jgi:predicted transcriptional regulator
VEGAALTDGKNVTNMDEKSKILNLLANGPQDAGGLSTRLGISRNTLFSLLMKMEKEGLIEWKGQEWAVKPSSDSKQSDLPDTSDPSEGGPNA